MAGFVSLTPRVKCVEGATSDTYDRSFVMEQLKKTTSFELGQILANAGRFSRASRRLVRIPRDFLARYVACDWGAICPTRTNTKRLQR